MKLLKRKTATIQDYINFAGLILFIYIILTGSVLVGSIDNLFVIENAIALTATVFLLEMLIVNLSIFITDFKNWIYDAKIEKKYGKRDSNEKEEG